MQDLREPQEILVFGEVLFDVFSDHETVLGGAPFNVAWHLQGFGVNPLFVSRVGQDPRGKEVRAAMARWGMRTDGLQEDPAHPTGMVTVTTRNGQPEYQILPEQAYDYIDYSEIENIPTTAGPHILYHGTLALRGPSHAALKQLKKVGHKQTFLDVNLRTPWWRPKIVQEAVMSAEVVKCNQDEFQQITAPGGGGILDAATDFVRKYALKMLVITKGQSGALLIRPNQPVLQAASPRVTDLVDTVGAGDAFSTILLLAQVHGWSPRFALTCAVEFAASACEWRGATIKDDTLYKDLLKRWVNDAGN